MIRDQFLKFFFIPFLGILIPFLSGIISYPRYGIAGLLGAHLYFIGMSWCIWSSAQYIHHKMRPLFSDSRPVFAKIPVVILLNTLLGGGIAALLSLLWFRISSETFTLSSYLTCVLLSVLAVFVFTLVYEILYLSKERELDNRMVDQLDRERSVAELSNLKNELEPHFIFNSLNTLSHLILTDPPTAHLFNSRLGSVYKYFLINKDKDLISLQNEVEFIENYFFLLQLRHSNMVHMNMELAEDENAYLILPFALQVAVENAIKHNEFGDTDPLYIRIEQQKDYLLVTNNRKEKASPEYSTGIGLKNLKMRYSFFCKKDIAIENRTDHFTLKLPLIHQNHIV